MSHPFSFTTETGKEVTVLGASSFSPQYVSVEIDGALSVRPLSLVLAHLTPSERSHIVARKKNDETPEIEPEPKVDEAQEDEAFDPNVVASSVLAMPVRQQEEHASNGEVELKKDADSVEDGIEPEKNSVEENQAIVEGKIVRPGETEQPSTETTKPETTAEPKQKEPTTGEVAGAWIRAQLEDGPKTKEELAKLAAESNPAKFPHPSKPGRKIPRDKKWIVQHGKVGEMIPGNASGWYIPEGIDSRKGGVDVLIDEKTKKLRLKK